MRLQEAIEYGKPTRRSGWLHWCIFPLEDGIKRIVHAIWCHNNEVVDLTFEDINATDWEIEGQ